MLKYALMYAAEGYNVIPISDNKTPLVKFADKKFSNEEIIKIWTEYPYANIAICTTDFFVVDIDVHGSINGYKSWLDWEYVSLFQKTIRQKTASGGAQLFYKKRLDIDITQNIAALKGVDIKAHINNYVLVPPSCTSKGVYEWVDNGIGEMVTPSLESCMALNDLKPKESNLSAMKKRHWTKQRFKNKDKIYGLGGEGGRNNALARLVGSLLSQGFNDNEILEMAYIANDATDIPLSNKEIETTVYSVIKTRMRG